MYQKSRDCFLKKPNEDLRPKALKLCRARCRLQVDQLAEVQHGRFVLQDLVFAFVRQHAELMKFLEDLEVLRMRGC